MVSKVKQNTDTKSVSKKQKQPLKPTTTAATNGAMVMPRESLHLSQQAGGNICQYPLVFTNDSRYGSFGQDKRGLTQWVYRYIFACVNRSINIYAVATGRLVKVLSRSPAEGGHTDTVVRVALNPKNAMQLYSFGLDGAIKLWDFNDEILLKVYIHTYIYIHTSMPIPGAIDTD